MTTRERIIQQGARVSMLHAALQAFGAIIMLALPGCGPGYESTPQAQPQAGSFSQGLLARGELAAHLSREGMILDTVYARTESGFAAVTGRAPDGTLHFLVLRRTQQFPLSVNYRVDVTQARPSQVAFIQDGPPDHDLYLWTVFDDPIEGIVGSALFGVTTDSATMVFRDDAMVCTPARLLPSRSSTLRLVAFQGDLAGGDCILPCPLALRSEFAMTAAWAEVHVVEGGNLRPLATDAEDFYRNLARTYERMLEWLPGHMAALECPEPAMRLQLNRWIEQALRRTR